MNHNLKPGDLALVTGGSFLLGSEVELIKWVMPGQVWIVFNGEERFLSPDSPSGGWHVRNGQATGLKARSHLMPLRGDFTLERQKAREVPA